MTKEEVLSAIRSMQFSIPDIDSWILNQYQSILVTGELPPGFYFSHCPEWKIGDSCYTVDWKDLTFEPVAATKAPKNFLGYTFRIRSRFISSRPLTSLEKHDLEDTTRQAANN